MPREELLGIYSALRQGELKLLYVAPERLMVPDFLDQLAEVAAVAICHRRGALHLAMGS